ncbi:unnamed protein product, partial [Anisakis simplex]|uniref:UBA domain-containing protein n=1 Tax=Anisakis simplex TaxID=6269 RepID=A0A0M3KFU1_ANISI
SSGAFRPQSVATTTALNAATSVSSKPLYTNPQPRSAAEIYASSSGILPPPSALLLGAQSSTTTAKNDSTTVNERSSSAFSSDQQERPQSQQFNQYRNQYAPLYVTSKTVSLASQNVSLSHQPIAVMQPSNPNSHIFYLPQQRTLTHRDSTPFLEGYARPGFFATPAIPSTSAMIGGGMTQTPQYGRQPLANIATGNNAVGALSRPTLGQNLLASDSQRPNTYSTSKNTPATTSSSGILQPTRSSPPAHRTSSMSDEILGLFDPLSTASSSNQPSASSSSEIKTNNLTQADAIETVVKNALFAGREKCVAMLAKCNNDVEQAIRELKTDEL